MKILIIDDEDDIRRIVRLSLERVGGMQVCDADNGAAGVAAARVERPDAILLDVMMPGMNGPAVLQALRRDALTAAIPVVFLTARLSPSELKRLSSLGAAGLLTKPFDPMTLAKQVTQLLDAGAGASRAESPS
jgi:CheY-like chemotaxis protein